MAVFTVHQPPLGKNENAPDAARFTFVRDGFYFWGFVLTALWMLRHRLWIVALLYVAWLSCCSKSAFDAVAGCHRRRWRYLVFVALAFLVGLEGGTLRGAGRWRGAASPMSASWWRTIRTTPSVASSSTGRPTSGRMRGRRLRARKAPRGLRPASIIRARSISVTCRDRRDRLVPATRAAAMTTAIVDYGSGNLHSAAKAFERAAREQALNGAIVVTSDPDEVVRAARIVLPGVGAFADCKRGLQAVPGMIEVLNEQVCDRASRSSASASACSPGAARLREGSGRRARLDRGRGPPHPPLGSFAEGAAYGLEYARACAPASVARRPAARRQGPARLFRAFL